jgi:hypothetical protein
MHPPKKMPTHHPTNATSPLVRKVKNEKACRTTPKHQSKTRRLHKTSFHAP